MVKHYFTSFYHSYKDNFHEFLASFYFILKTMPKQMKLSPIWDYYTETDDPKYAQCKICKEKKLLGCNNNLKYLDFKY